MPTASTTPTDAHSMRAAILTGYGDADKLQMRTVPRPTPAAGQVLVRVRAAGVNDWDWGLVTGMPRISRLFQGLFRPRRTILGLDVAGEVTDVAPGVTRFRRGDRVLGDLSSHGFGGFAEFVATDDRAFTRMPDTMSFTDAAALPHAANLALQALTLADLKPHDRLLINGAGGGVGSLAVQIATHRGVTDIVGVDHASKLDFLRELGFARALDYTATDFTRLPEKFDVVIDAKSTRSPSSYARVLAPGGRYVTVGGNAGSLLGLAVWGRLVGRRTGTRLSLVMLKANVEMDAVVELYNSGVLRPRIDSVRPLAQIADAMARFGRGEHRGKVVVEID